MITPAYLTRKQASAYLGVSESQLDNWRRAGRIPCYRPLTDKDNSRIVRFAVRDLEAFMADAQIGGAA